MSMTRLRFLSMLSSGFAVAAAGPARLLASPDRQTAAFSQQTFQQLTNTTFTVHGPNGQVGLVLKVVKAGPQDPLTSQFSLAFAGPRSARLPEGTYPVTHPALTSFSLHISPAGVGGDGKPLFRADFNLLH